MLVIRHLASGQSVDTQNCAYGYNSSLPSDANLPPLNSTSFNYAVKLGDAGARGALAVGMVVGGTVALGFSGFMATAAVALGPGTIPPAIGGAVLGVGSTVGSVATFKSGEDSLSDANKTKKLFEQASSTDVAKFDEVDYVSAIQMLKRAGNSKTSCPSFKNKDFAEFRSGN